MKANKQNRNHKNKQNRNHNSINIIRAALIYGAVMAIVIYLCFSFLG